MLSRYNRTMVWLILIPFIPLGAFWYWMFKDMRQNQYLPRCPFSVTNNPDPKVDWTIAFATLTILAAAYYYYYERRA